MLLGDFNAKHPRWDRANPADPRGRIVEKILIDEPVDILNKESPTHFHKQTGTRSTIDLSMCSVDALTDFNWNIGEYLHGSDHYPIYVTSKEYLPQQDIPRWREKKANWEQFTVSTDQMENIPDLSPTEFIKAITTKIQEAAEMSIPKSSGYYTTSPVPWWNEDCEKAKCRRNKSEKNMNKNSNLTNKINYKRLRAFI